MNIEELTHNKIEELLEYLDAGHKGLVELIYHDKLYDLAQSIVIDNLAAEAEARADEEKLKDYDEQNTRTN